MWVRRTPCGRRWRNWRPWFATGRRNAWRRGACRRSCCRETQTASFPSRIRIRSPELISGRAGEAVRGPYSVKLCCEFFGGSCLLALVSGEPAGYVLSFVREREAYCTTLAVAPRFQGSRVAIRLVGGLVAALEPLVDSCWFTVKRDNASARALHAALGAKDVE